MFKVQTLSRGLAAALLCCFAIYSKLEAAPLLNGFASASQANLRANGGFTASDLPPLAPDLYADLLPQYAVKEDDQLFLSVGVTAYPLNIFWFHDGALVPSLTNTFFYFDKIGLADQGKWWLICSNALGIITSKVTQIEVQPAIDFVSGQLGSVTIDLNHLVVTNWPTPALADLNGHTLTLDITGGQDPFVSEGSWEIDLAASFKYKVPAGVMPAASGSWLRRQDNAYTIALDLRTFYGDGATATLTLVNDHYFELTKPGVVANQHGQWSLDGLLPILTTNLPKASFSLVASTAKGTLTYQWYKEGNIVPGATGTELTFDPAKVEDSGNYTCVVSRSDGKTRTSSAASLKVLGDAITGDVSFQLSKGQFVVSWPAGTKLQTTSDLNGKTWETSQATSPAPFSLKTKGQFFRWIAP